MKDGLKGNGRETYLEVSSLWERNQGGLQEGACPLGLSLKGEGSWGEESLQGRHPESQQLARSRASWKNVGAALCDPVRRNAAEPRKGN